MLEWKNDSLGTWSAVSGMSTHNRLYKWRICVCSAGDFTTIDSSPVLMSGLVASRHSTLAEAQAFCETREAELRKGVEAAQKPDQNAEPIVQKISARWQQDSEWESHPNLVQLDRLRGIHVLLPVRAGVMTRFECQMADGDVVTITGKPSLIIMDAAGQISITFPNPTFVAVDG